MKGIVKLISAHVHGRAIDYNHGVIRVAPAIFVIKFECTYAVPLHAPTRALHALPAGNRH